MTARSSIDRYYWSMCNQQTPLLAHESEQDMLLLQKLTRRSPVMTPVPRIEIGGDVARADDERNTSAIRVGRRMGP